MTHPVDLAQQLRDLADTIAGLHADEALPDLHMSLAVQVAPFAPQPDRIRGVVRLNEALGRSGHVTYPGSSSQILRGTHDVGEPYAFCALDAPVVVPVADVAAMFGGGAA